MPDTWTCALAAFVLAVLCGGQALAAWSAPLPEGADAVLTVPRMDSPPSIDGTIDAAEWRGATAVSGVGGCTDNLLYARPTIFWLGWDPGHIYMAGKVWLRPRFKPQVSGREPHTAVVYDDTFEFHWLPMGANVPSGRTTSSFKWLVNALGTDGDFMRVSVGQQFKNWNPRFRIAARVTAEGTGPRGGKWLEFELSSTPEDFELKGAHRSGDRWKMMLGTNHMYVGWDQARIPCTTSYFDPGGYPVCTLAENAPAIQVLSDEFAFPHDGALRSRVQVHNPTDAPVRLQMRARVAAMDRGASEGKEELVAVERPIEVAPGRTEVVALDEAFAPVGERKGSLKYELETEKATLHRYAQYFLGSYNGDAHAPVPPPKRAFPLAVRFNPVSSEVEIRSDAYYLPDPARARRVLYEVRRAGANEPLTAGAITRSITSIFTARVTLPALRPGAYEVEARMELADGTVLGPEKATISKREEAEEYSEWWHNDIGDVERVIWPFTAIELEGDRLSPWGRTYELDGLGLPRQIVSQGKAVSAGAARIVLTVGGKETVVPVAARPTLTETKPWRVSFRGTSSAAGVAFRASGWLEQDGLVYVELTYGSELAPVTVDALRIEFPLSDEEGECLLCLGTGGNYSARTTLVLPEKTQGPLWSTLVTGLNGAQMTVGSFYPCVWVGNERRGFLWHGDSDEGWVPRDDVPAHELVRRGDALVLQSNVIGAPFELREERTIAFTYMASPFKPMPKGWRASIYSEDGTFHGPNKIVKDAAGNVVVDGWAWLTPPSKKPEEWAAMWASYKPIADERCRRLKWRDPSLARNKYGSTVHTSLPLMGYDWKSPDTRVTGYFEADWTRGDTWNATERDYFTWIISRAFREGGLRTIYWDIFMLHQFRDPLAGVGYELPDGRIQPAYNGLNIRRFMQRIWALQDDLGLTPGGQVTHCTNDYLLVASAWVDAHLDGEYHSITDDSGMDWVDGYPVERMRSMSVSGTFGNQITWMSLMSFKDKAKERATLRGKTDYLRLYDTWRDWGPLAMEPFEWGLNDPKVQYHPFWRNPHVVSGEKDVLVSAWTLPGRAILSVFNYDRERVKDVKLKLDLEALGLRVRVPWIGGVTAQTLFGVAGDFDPLTGTMDIRQLQPHTGATIGLRAVEKRDYDLLRDELTRAAAGLADPGIGAGLLSRLADDGYADVPVRAAASDGIVSCTDPSLAVSVVALNDRVLVTIANRGNETRNGSVAIDLDRLRLVPREPWTEFVRERDYGPCADATRRATLDFHARTLRVPLVAPGTLRVVGVRRY